jgi:hypothetical protein
MTERSRMSRRQALRYGGLAAALPLLPAVWPAGKASPGGNSPVPQQAAPSQLALAVDGPGDVRISRVGRRGGHMRCQLQFPSIRDHVDLGGDSNQTGNDISGGSNGQ